MSDEKKVVIIGIDFGFDADHGIFEAFKKPEIKDNLVKMIKEAHESDCEHYGTVTFGEKVIRCGKCGIIMPEGTEVRSPSWTDYVEDEHVEIFKDMTEEEFAKRLKAWKDSNK